MVQFLTTNHPNGYVITRSPGLVWIILVSLEALSEKQWLSSYRKIQIEFTSGKMSILLLIIYPQNLTLGWPSALSFGPTPIFFIAILKKELKKLYISTSNHFSYQFQKKTHQKSLGAPTIFCSFQIDPPLKNVLTPSRKRKIELRNNKKFKILIFI